MDALKIFEEKLTKLAERIKELSAENSQLLEETKELRTENSNLVEENAQLSAKVSLLEKNLMDDSRRIDELKQEKELTKLVVDDLIKSIDSLVENQS